MAPRNGVFCHGTKGHTHGASGSGLADAAHRMYGSAVDPKGRQMAGSTWERAEKGGVGHRELTNDNKLITSWTPFCQHRVGTVLTMSARMTLGRMPWPPLPGRRWP